MIIRRIGRPFVAGQLKRHYVNSNNILPECFRIDPTKTDSNAKKEDPSPHPAVTVPPVPHDFHSLAAGGYNGLLAKSFEYNRRPELLIQLHESMERAGISKNVTSYNYLISAYLGLKDVEGAYRQVYEMEYRGLTPNVMTFEVLMEGLCRLTNTACTIDDLFAMMQVKYDLVPSVNCWQARLICWASQKTQEQAISQYNTARQSSVYCKNSSKLHTSLLKTAVRRGCWRLVDAILPNIRIGSFAFANGDRALVPVKDLMDIWSYQRLFDEESCPSNYEMIRFLVSAMPQLTKSSYTRLLYFATSEKVDAPDLAEIAMTGIIKALKQDSSDSVRIPAHYMEAYLAAMRPRARSADNPERLTAPMQHKIKLFERALGTRQAP